MTVRRFDSGALASPVRLDNGYLRCDARITRVGVFTYRNADGTQRRELRTPANVFKQDALDSFALVPLTNNHPHEALTDKNTRKFQVGVVAGVRADEGFVRATVQIMDDAAIRDAENGKRELSCGYNCDLDDTPGVTRGIPGVSDGQRYDAIQTNIQGNHVALVERGRAGGEAALRLDASDAWMIDSAPGGSAVREHGEPKENGTMKLNVDGVSVEVDEQAAQIITNSFAKKDERIAHLDAELETSKSATETEKARADKATEDLDTEKKARTDAEAPDKLETRVAERLDLYRNHERVLGDKDADGKEFKLDGMADADIMRAVVLHASPGVEAKLKDCSDAYLQARYDAALESAEESRDDDAGGAFRGVNRADATNTGGQRTDADAARDRMILRNQDAWKKNHPNHSDQAASA